MISEIVKYDMEWLSWLSFEKFQIAAWLQKLNDRK
jgi:hypothetical protein